MKKILAILLAMAMVFSLAVAVSAEEVVIYEGTITFDGTAGSGWWLVSSDPAVDTSHNGQLLDGFDGNWHNITRVVFTSEQGNFTLAYREADGTWNQQDDAASEYELVFADINIMLDSDGTTIKKEVPGVVAIPEVMVACSVFDGVEHVINYTVYAEVEAVEPEEDIVASDLNEVEYEEDPVDEPETDDNYTDVPLEPTNSAPAAPATGIAFAVVPAIVAMAAAAVSKKR